MDAREALQEDRLKAFMRQVRKVCGFMPKSIESTHRLISQHNARLLMKELYSPQFKRVIAMPSDSAVAKQHMELAEARASVFSVFGVQEGLELLIVPEGAKPITSVLKASAHNVERAKLVFAEVGNVLSDLHKKGFGLPGQSEERPLLEQLAFATDEQSPHGGRIYLIPPYEFSHSVSPETAQTAIAQELTSSGLFHSDEISNLIEAVQLGWYEDSTKA